MICTTGWAQAVSIKPDREKILIGEQITLLLKAENLKGNVATWFNMPDTVNHIEVVKRSKIDTIDIAGNQILQQTITITSFDSGRWQIPALVLTVEDGSRFTTLPIDIDVVPVDVSQMENYHDIKEIVEVEQESNKLIIILIVLITLVALAAVYYLVKRKKPRVIPAPKLQGNLSPREWALQELEKLRNENLWEHNQVKQHYQRLTDITRQFFFMHLQHKSLNQTTDEWMVKLQSLSVSQPVKTTFMQLLRLADTVKFAKYLPPSGENIESINVARQMVEQAAELKEPQIFSSTKKS